MLIVTELTDHAAFNGSVYDVGMRLDEKLREDTGNLNTRGQMIDNVSLISNPCLLPRTHHTDNEPLFFFIAVSIGCTHGTYAVNKATSTGMDMFILLPTPQVPRIKELSFVSVFILPYQVQCKYKSLHQSLCD